MIKNRFTKAIIAAAGAVALVAGQAAVAKADTYDELFYWVDWMAQKYGLGTVYVAEAPLPPGVYGASQGTTIVFSTAYVENPGKLQADLAADVAEGFHPGRGCTATQYLAAHESAHVLDYLTGYSARYELATAIKNGLSGQVSGYSFTDDGDVNLGETLADAMAAVECDTPTPAESAIYGMLTT